ncbi:hypothetical protein, partial [Aeromonas hydrophila]|uniref:hypothetical protein n=1 Tax=Aeromonas hydrophila TaxID=644 RepID=UPI004039B7EC
LVRGIEGSKATHKRIKAHYNALGQQIPVPPEIREEDLGRYGDLLPQRVVMGLDALVGRLAALDAPHQSKVL